MKIRSAVPLLSLLTALCFTSCKKETHEVSYPFKEIRTFIVPGVDGVDLSVAVDNNTLTLYWPGTSSIPTEITPKITVSERATISPASGEKVALKDGATYTVTAQDGSKAVYTLKLVNNQPPPTIIETPQTFGLYTELYVFGNYFIPNITKTKAYLVDGTGKETLLPPIGIKRDYISLFLDSYEGKGIAPGKYKIKITTGDKSVTSITDFITLESRGFAAPYVFNNSTTPLNLKRGSQVTIPVRNLDENTINRITLNGVRLTIIGPSADGKGIIADLPADFTTGDYYSVGIRYFNPSSGLGGTIEPIFPTAIRVTE